MEINWEYLTSPIGKHWADKYINYKMINTMMRDGWRIIKWKQGGFQDIGLKDYRFATTSGNLRPLLGSSVKIEKDDGSDAFVRVLYLSPSKESSLPIDMVFPNKWTLASPDNCLSGVPVPKYRLNPRTSLVCQNCGKPVGINLHRNNPPLMKPEAFKFKYQAGMNTCGGAGACKFTCITTSGQMTQQQRTRYAKTWYFMTEPVIFIRQILTEVYIYSQEAFINQMLFYCRLNGTSDIPWEYLIKMDKMTKDVQGLGGFYDYTKLPWSKRGGKDWAKYMGRMAYPKYYHLTFSLDEKKTKTHIPYLERGYGVSVVTPEKTVKQLLKDIATEPAYDFMIDGDLTDFRFSDPVRAIVLLKSKGALVQKSSYRQDRYNQYLRWIKGVDLNGKKGKKREKSSFKKWEKEELDYLKDFFGVGKAGSKTLTDFDLHEQKELKYLYSKRAAYKKSKEKLPTRDTKRIRTLESGCFDFENDYLMTKAFRQLHKPSQSLQATGCSTLMGEQARPITLERDYSFIVNMADTIAEMNRTSPIKERPNILEKPTAFQTQAIGIVQTEGDMFYDTATPFHDLVGYKAAQVGRITKKEAQKKKDEGKDEVKREAEIALLNRYYELKADVPKLTQAKAAKAMDITANKLRSLLKKEKEGKLQRANPRHSQRTKFAEYDMQNRHWVITDGSMIYDIEGVYSWPNRSTLESVLDSHDHYLDHNKIVREYR